MNFVGHDDLQFHPYEGHPMSIVVYPIRVLAHLGVKNLISRFHLKQTLKNLCVDLSL